jgi:tRNA-modifying protein YgfZ
MAALYRLNRTFIRVSGPDALNFLNNLLTQSLWSSARVAYGALLSPQGKLVADMLIWTDEDGLILDVDPARGGDLLRRLNLYKLRANVAISEALQITAAWSPEAFEGASDDPRLAMLGARKLISADEGLDLPDGAEAYAALRLTLGAPDLAHDADIEEVFALEALLEELHGVDFQKGCFVGQENVSRMKRRATTRKKFCPISFVGDAPPFGAPISANEAEIGAVRTGRSGRAMALVRLDRAQEALAAGLSLAVAGRPVQLDPPPWLIRPGPAGEGD